MFIQSQTYTKESQAEIEACHLIDRLTGIEKKSMNIIGTGKII